VSIARAVLKAPRLYVFDEATSSLDSATEREIIHNLRHISRTCTTLIIAHRLSTVVHAEQIIVMDRGRIVERGTHAELLRAGGLFSQMWALQQQRAAEPLASDDALGQPDPQSESQPDAQPDAQPDTARA
jgi:ATP-binding cassette subfamily B protein